MNERPRIACPKCGTPMNFHAVKVDTTLRPEESAQGPGWGGVLSEFHTCPNPKCRFVLERPAA